MAKESMWFPESVFIISLKIQILQRKAVDWFTVINYEYFSQNHIQKIVSEKRDASEEKNTQGD